MFLCVCAEETGRVKNCLGECSLKVTRPDGECSKILVSNPACTTLKGADCSWDQATDSLSSISYCFYSILCLC